LKSDALTRSMSSILIHIPSAPRAERQSTTPDRPTSFSILFTAACIRPGSFQSTWRGVYNQKSTLQVQPASRPSRRALSAQSYKSKPVMCARREENYDCGPCVHTYVLLPVCVCVYNSNHTERRVPMRVLITRSAHENPHTRKPKAPQH
jgi:hypothetical protein